MSQNIYDRQTSIKYVKARVIQDPQSLAPASNKSGVAFAEVGERYYVIDYNANNPKDEGLGQFVEIVDDPAAKCISVKRLRYIAPIDLTSANSIGELLAMVYPLYIIKKNYFAAVDEAAETLMHYNHEHVETLLNKAEQIYYFDLNWLTSQSLPPRIKRLSVDVYTQDGCKRPPKPNQTEFTWDLLQEAAVLTITFIDNASLHYILYPTFDGKRTSTRLIRLEKGLDLYTDTHGNLHSIDFKKFIGDFLHFELDNLTAKYYVKNQKAAMAPIGSGDGVNNQVTGFEFALSYIDPTNIPNVNQFLTDIEQIEKGNLTEVAIMEPVDGKDSSIGSSEHGDESIAVKPTSSDEQVTQTVGEHNENMGE